MTAEKGWICPVCNRGVAPSVSYCDHAGVPTHQIYWPVVPTYPTTCQRIYPPDPDKFP